MKNSYRLFHSLGIIIVLSYFYFITPAIADTTYVSGTIVNQTWTPSGSPYIMTGDIFVAGLTINSGVRVLAGGNYQFEIAGVINAIGTQQSQIIFTTKDNVVSWKGMLFQNSSPGSNLVWCIIEKSSNSGIRIVESLPTLNNCTIRNNTAPQFGGGINISNTITGKLVISNCIIENNLIQGALSSGGGCYIGSGSVDLVRCEFLKNRLSSTTQALGGAISSGGNVLIQNCKITENKVSSNDSRGAAVFLAGGGATTIKNSIIAYDTLNGPDGTVYLYSGQLFIENCSIVRNNAQGLVNHGTMNVINSIIYFNNNNGTQISGTPTVTYSDIQGVYTGVGNINLNPVLDPLCLHILPGSPCIDSGSTASEYNDICFTIPPNVCDTNNRLSLGSVRNDMGAHGGPDACGWNLTGVNQVSNIVPDNYLLFQNYPNPFNPVTTISFSIPSRSVISLKVFDISGKEISTLVAEELTTGTYKYKWDASAFPSGVYFYRLEAGSYVET